MVGPIPSPADGQQPPSVRLDAVESPRVQIQQTHKDWGPPEGAIRNNDGTYSIPEDKGPPQKFIKNWLNQIKVGDQSLKMPRSEGAREESGLLQIPKGLDFTRDYVRNDDGQVQFVTEDINGRPCLATDQLYTFEMKDENGQVRTNDNGEPLTITFKQRIYTNVVATGNADAMRTNKAKAMIAIENVGRHMDLCFNQHTRSKIYKEPPLLGSERDKKQTQALNQEVRRNITMIDSDRFLNQKTFTMELQIAAYSPTQVQQNFVTERFKNAISAEKKNEIPFTFSPIETWYIVTDDGKSIKEVYPSELAEVIEQHKDDPNFTLCKGAEAFEKISGQAQVAEFDTSAAYNIDPNLSPENIIADLANNQLDPVEFCKKQKEKVEEKKAKFDELDAKLTELEKNNPQIRRQVHLANQLRLAQKELPNAHKRIKEVRSKIDSLEARPKRWQAMLAAIATGDPNAIDLAITGESPDPEKGILSPNEQEELRNLNKELTNLEKRVLPGLIKVQATIEQQMPDKVNKALLEEYAEDLDTLRDLYGEINNISEQIKIVGDVPKNFGWEEGEDQEAIAPSEDRKKMAEKAYKLMNTQKQGIYRSKKMTENGASLMAQIGEDKEKIQELMKNHGHEPDIQQERDSIHNRYGIPLRKHLLPPNFYRSMDKKQLQRQLNRQKILNSELPMDLSADQLRTQQLLQPRKDKRPWFKNTWQTEKIGEKVKQEMKGVKEAEGYLDRNNIGNDLLPPDTDAVGDDLDTHKENLEKAIDNLEALDRANNEQMTALLQQEMDMLTTPLEKEGGLEGLANTGHVRSDKHLTLSEQEFKARKTEIQKIRAGIRESMEHANAALGRIAIAQGGEEELKLGKMEHIEEASAPEEEELSDEEIEAMDYKTVQKHIAAREDLDPRLMNQLRKVLDRRQGGGGG